MSLNVWNRFNACIPFVSLFIVEHTTVRAKTESTISWCTIAHQCRRHWHNAQRTHTISTKTITDTSFNSLLFECGNQKCHEYACFMPTKYNWQHRQRENQWMQHCNMYCVSLSMSLVVWHYTFSSNNALTKRRPPTCNRIQLFNLTRLAFTLNLCNRYFALQPNSHL